MRDELRDELRVELPFRERLIPTNHGFGNRPKAIVIHETDNEMPSAGALNHSLYFATPGVRVSCHYVVDDDEVIRLLHHDKVAWHCGKPLGEYSNRNTIGIEICVNGRYYPAWYRAAQLTAALMDETGISVLLRHRDVSGKNCPRRMNEDPMLWKQFCRIVREHRGVMALKQAPGWEPALSCPDVRAHRIGIVTAGRLNVRSGRGVTHPVIGTLPRGTPVRLLYHLKGWWSIDYGPNVGFVSGKYIEETGR